MGDLLHSGCLCNWSALQCALLVGRGRTDVCTFQLALMCKKNLEALQGVDVDSLAVDIFVKRHD